MKFYNSNNIEPSKLLAIKID